MPRPQAKSFRNPDEIRRFPNGRIENVSHNETTVGRFFFEPGWRWSRDVGPIARTRSCQIHHQGVVLKGRLRVESDTGEVCEVGVDDVYDFPPGHDAAVVGDEPFEAIEFASARVFAVSADGDRVLAAVLCTDIVDSTAQLRRLGDSAWRELLLDPNLQVRSTLTISRARDTNDWRWIPCSVRRSRPRRSMRLLDCPLCLPTRHRDSRWGSHWRGGVRGRQRTRPGGPRNRTRRECSEGRRGSGFNHHHALAGRFGDSAGVGRSSRTQRPRRGARAIQSY